MNHEQPNIPGNRESDYVASDQSRDIDGAPDWIALARTAYEEGEEFYNKLKERWEINYALAQSEHPPGSKYKSEAYKHRPGIFRGKTESSIRKNEAALVVALFSNQDAVSITAHATDDEAQDQAAEALDDLANYYLNSAEWFITAMSAFHETMVPGVIVSRQYWDDTGPVSELIPPEMVKISPEADWLDPLNSSPYVVIQTPIYVGDVLERMATDEWFEYDEATILASRPDHDSETTKRSRNDSSADEPDSAVNDFVTIEVHENIIRREGVDYVYFTLGTKHLLTEPVPLSEIYPHTARTGRRNLQMGTSTIEPFKVYKRSLTDRVKNTQFHANELASQRVENVRKVLNRRYFALRGSGTDYVTLKKSVAGSVIMTNDLNAVKPEEVIDVTPSSYQEQHVLNADFDELAGSFSSGSVMTNRALNETVGGMNLMKGDSNALTEYQLKVFVMTWVEPVIREIVAILQTHCPDQIIQAVTAKQLTLADLQTPIKVDVSVGYGATDPIGKAQRLILAIDTLTQRIPAFVERLDVDALSAEVFGLIGYQDGKKFLKDEEEDPNQAMLKEKLEQLIAYIESEKLKHDQKLQEIDRKGRWDLSVEALRNENRLQVKDSDRQVALTKAALDRNVKDQDHQLKASTVQLEWLAKMIDLIEAENQTAELAAKKSGQIEEGI